MESVSIIIPAFNEKELLESTVLEAIETTSRLAFPCEFIIVDDGSTDGTALIADHLADLNKNITVLHHSSNRGLGAALISGFHKAKHNLITSIPADGQINPKDIALYYEAIQEADFVTSYRLNPSADPLYRRMLSRGLRIILFFIFGPTPRLELGRMFRREILERIKIRSDTAMANVELMIKAYRAGYRFKEIGVEFRPRKMGKSKVTKTTKIILVMIEIIKLRLSDDYRSLKGVRR